MHEQGKRAGSEYPIGRGYGNDIMRGGEVFGGYGYSERPEYELRRGDLEQQRRQQAKEPDASA